MAVNCTVISEEAFMQMISDSGVLLSDFDPTNPIITKENIITATTGGINVSCVATFSDWGEDIDNVPDNMAEFKHHDGWDAKMSFTALCATLEVIKLALGCADIDKGKGTVTPRNKIKLSDFKPLWWSCNTIDGGNLACCLDNAFSTGGLSIQSEKNGKGQISVEMTGHTSIKAQNKSPMTYYLIKPTESDADTLLLEKDDTPVEY